MSKDFNKQYLTSFFQPKPSISEYCPKDLDEDIFEEEFSEGDISEEDISEEDIS